MASLGGVISQVGAESWELLSLPLALAWSGAFLFLRWRFAHRFVSLHQISNTEPLRSDDELFELNKPAEYEPTDEEIAELRVAAGLPTEPVGSAWECRTCKEENTGEFRFCWNCGREYDGDPTA